MKRVSALSPALFGLEGILFILRATQIVAWFGSLIATRPFGLDLQVFWQAFGPNLRSILLVFGISGLIVAWGLTQKKRWAWRGGLVLAGLHLAVFPFLAPAGLLLIALLLKGKDEFLGTNPLARMQWERTEEGKKVPWTYNAVVASVVVAIGLGAYTLVQYSQQAGFPKLPLLAIPVVVLGAAFIRSVIHEMGHAAGAVLAGFQLANFSVGPFWLSRNMVGWKWKFVPNLGWTGALATARPLTDHNLHTNVFLFLAGGPVATLLLGTISLILFLAGRDLPWAWCADGFGILALIALIDFLAEMSLVRKGHVFTDGARIMQLWTGGLERRRLLATYALGLCETTARRPAEWRPEWLEEATSDPASPLYFAGCYYAYVYELDRRDWEKAGHWLDELLGSDIATPSKARRGKAAIEGAYYEALFRDDAVRARQWLSAPRDGLAVEQVSEWRAEAAVHLAEGDLEGCAERILKIRARLAEAPSTGWKLFELTLVERLDQKLRGASAESISQLDAVVRLDFQKHGKLSSSVA